MTTRAKAEIKAPGTGAESSSSECDYTNDPYLKDFNRKCNKKMIEHTKKNAHISRR